MNTAQKLRVAIIGGGIGGLTCAVALKDCKDVQVDLYEAAAHITEIGAGIALWPRTWEIMKILGLDKDLNNLVHAKEKERLQIGETYARERSVFEFRMSDRSEGFTFHHLMIPNDGANYYWHRQELQQTLLSHFPSSTDSSTFTIHLSHRLAHCTELPSSVKLHFTNGEEKEYDVVIGADGIKSVIRQAVLGHVGPVMNPLENSGVFFTGSRAYRGVIAKEKLEAVSPSHRTLMGAIIYCGKDKHIIAFPMSQDRYVNVVAFFTRLEEEGTTPQGPDVRECTKEEVLKEFEGWEKEVEVLLSSIDKPTCWTIRDLKPLEKFTTKRLTLLGDAAHAMTPHLGAGAGQAIEDAYILGSLFTAAFASATSITPDDKALRILEAYNTIRRPYATRVRGNARSQGMYYELNAEELKEAHPGPGTEVTEGEVELLRSVLTGNWTWAWEERVGDELEKGLSVLGL